MNNHRGGNANETNEPAGVSAARLPPWPFPVALVPAPLRLGAWGPTFADLAAINLSQRALASSRPPDKTHAYGETDTYKAHATDLVAKGGGGYLKVLAQLACEVFPLFPLHETKQPRAAEPPTQIHLANSSYRTPSSSDLPPALAEHATFTTTSLWS